MEEDLKTSVESIRRWIAEHDGRINAWWSTQHRWNSKIEERIERVGTRMNAMEKKVAFYSGGAALLGSVLGVLLSWLLSGGAAG